MADRVLKVSYCTVSVPARAGRAAGPLEALREAGVGLLAFSGFPTGGGKAQLDFVAQKMAPVRRVLQRGGWRPSVNKRGFLVQGRDETGCVHRQLRKLADAKINVTAADAVAAGQGRYAMILWVRSKDYARAARALGAR